MKTKTVVVFAALALCAAQSFATQSLPFKRGINCRGLDESAYSTSTWGKTYIYGLDNTYTDIKSKGFDFVRFSVDLTKYYDSDNDRFYNSGSYNIENIDLFMQKFLDAGLSVHLLMGRFNGGDINLANDDERTFFKKVWRRVAERYQSWSDKVAFELLNEPKMVPLEQQGMTTLQATAALNGLLKETVNVIRETNPTRYILWPIAYNSCCYVLTWNGEPPNFSLVTLPKNDPHIVVVVHSYEPLAFTHQGADWCYDENGNKRNYHVDLSDAHRQTLRRELKYISQYAKAFPDVPIVLNEFGVMCGKSTPSDAHEWLSTVREFIEAKDNMAWALFEYTDFNYGQGMGARAAPGGEWRTNVVDALFPKGWDDQPSNYGQLDMDGFSKKLQVTFAGYDGTEALTNFPVLAKLSSAISGFSYDDFQQKSTGGDLRFADSTGRQIPHEIDTWNTNGVSTVWVRVPTLTAATKIYACYGCANPPAVTAMDVWDGDYMGVWHLNEGCLPLYESSRRGPSFTQRNGQNLSFAASGVVGGSVDFGDGFSNAVIAVDHDNLDGFEKFTIEAWTKQSAHKAVGGILSKRLASNRELSYYFYDKDGKTMLKASTNGTSGVECIYTIQPNLNQWNHQVYAFDTTTASSNLKGYLNGAAAGTASKAFGKIFAGVGYLTLGNLLPDAMDNSFNGSIDEVRVSKCVRSADWVKATHDTVANSNFATYTFDISGLDDPEPECGSLAMNDYAKAIDVTFSGAPSDATLTNFPVLVKLSTAISGFSYADFARQNGGDLRFADASGNLIPHEIDTWNPSGVSTVWVKVPQLTKDTAITAHYGYTGSGDPAEVDPKDVWDSNYVGVWHLGESALPMAESTGVSTPFASKTGTASYGAAGAVGGSVDVTAAQGT
ncbi:MAG: DUF2341 domain-containing protein, partial [Kiritimatiellae bacterium]|nr:DUF2341 domain-containing protein [Kiritimatiellia bacterium]